MRLGNRSSITTSEHIVTSAGTAEQLPNVKVPQGCEVTITAKHGNLGRVFPGGTKAEAEAQTISLGPDDVFHDFLTNLNCLWLDVETDGEGIDYAVPQ